MELKFASIAEIARAVKDKKISAKEITTYFLNRIESLDSKLNSFTALNQKAIKQAEDLDVRIAHGEAVGVLAGVPFGIKEMLCTKGIQTTAGSKMLSNFVPPYDSTVVSRLKASDSIILGKLNQDEFAMGSSNETSFHGSVKNPWNLDFVPGGSSGGSAAAQAARLVAGSIGTDTGGSIRQPSSFCGIVGVKPTYGRVSRYGVVAFASSLDQAGPMVSSVEDAALTLEVICGHDEMDSTTSQRPVPQWSKNISTNMNGIKVGLIKEYMRGGLDADVQRTFDESIEALKKMGAQIIELSISMTDFSVPVYYLVSGCEASSNLARYDGVRYGYRSDFKNLSSISLDEFYGKTRGEGFGSEVKRRIMLGTYCLSSGYYDAYYLKACQVRRLLTNQYLEGFQKCDVILSPVTTSPAFKIGERINDPLEMYLNDIFTTSTNLAGLPGMSIPFGISKQGLPIGMQITAKHYDEQRMLNVAAALESVSPVKGLKPYVI